MISTQAHKKAASVTSSGFGDGFDSLGYLPWFNSSFWFLLSPNTSLMTSNKSARPNQRPRVPSPQRLKLSSRPRLFWRPMMTFRKRVGTLRRSANTSKLGSGLGSIRVRRVRVRNEEAANIATCGSYAWARDDSNVRPRPYQGRALTN